MLNLTCRAVTSLRSVLTVLWKKDHKVGTHCLFKIYSCRHHHRHYNKNNNNDFVPVAMESMGPLGREASEFLTDLGRRLSMITECLDN